MKSEQLFDTYTGNEIAIIGLNGRFPGAQEIEAFWLNLRDGAESVHFFSDEELEAAGVAPEIIHDPRYVKARSPLDDVELFDASFFGYSPYEARLIDPQQRLFLESSWQALESAGYNPKTYKGPIGVYGSLSTNTYFLYNVYPHQDILQDVGLFELHHASDTTFLATRVSYKLDLHGPSMTVQTGCSMSLVAVHLACQSLLSGENDIALAGGVSVMVPQREGYLYQGEGIASPDGHCRAFDEQAGGPTSGSGLGIVVLKRLADALEDRDTIHAVIKGSAINNDGAAKVGFTAPSVTGQAEVITQALAMADVSAETISYVEAHGSGTPLGDPIEVQALTKAFRGSTDKKGFCAIGSVKTNVGHLDAAAGVAGLIKTVLALKHRQIPASLNFVTPNPHIDFANSPFYVNTALTDWETGDQPLRAGVSSFGIGGTNAHVIVEEAPIIRTSEREKTRSQQLLMLSAKTATALKAAVSNLATHLQCHPEQELADVAYTLQVGRQEFAHRQIAVCHDRDEAIQVLEAVDPRRVIKAYHEPVERKLVFLFSGQGTQYVNMGLELYQAEPLFRQRVDRCAELLQPHLGLDIREVIYPTEESIEAAYEYLEQTWLAQPALFTIEYALAQLWMSWGIEPDALIGHSIGEYVAACLAGVFSLEDALYLVAARARLMQQVPQGTMLAVPLAEQEANEMLGEELSLAAVNAPDQCVVSGPEDAVLRFARTLASQQSNCMRLPTTCASHSKMMEPILAAFAEQVRQVEFHAPQKPYISGVSGSWITEADTTQPAYWVKQLRQTVRFADGLQTAISDPALLLLEVGPGRTLCNLVQQQPQSHEPDLIFASLPASADEGSLKFLLTTLGRLWLAGAEIAWGAFYAEEERYRIPLPTYPFERQRYWVDAPRTAAASSKPAQQLERSANIADWFYVPCWKQSVPLSPIHGQDIKERKVCYLVFRDECGIGDALVQWLRSAGQKVSTVSVGERFARIDVDAYSINRASLVDYQTLFDELVAQKSYPQEIIQLWSVTASSQGSSDAVENGQSSGFYDLFLLTQALHLQGKTERLVLRVISNDMQSVVNEVKSCPQKATLLGPCLVIPQEYPHIVCTSIDLSLPPRGSWQEKRLLEQLIKEITLDPVDSLVAYRADQRWVQTFESVPLSQNVTQAASLRDGAVYLITGGLGRIGMAQAELLTERVQRPKLILTGRSGLPERDVWTWWLETHGDQDVTGQKIRKVQHLEEQGAEVLVCRADVTNAAHMQQVLMLIEQQFGELHGVLHSAGSVTEEEFYTISEADPDRCKEYIRSKMQGMQVLAEVLRDKELDFCLVQSSLSPILGGMGFVSYAAAHCFLDAFVQQQNLEGPTPWITINWGEWNFEEKPEIENTMGARFARFAINKEQGKEALARIFSLLPLSRIVVSPANLHQRLEQWTRLDTQDRDTHSVSKTSALQPRPGLQVTYVAPRNAIEETLATIWQNQLGIEQVGIYDNFFDLGGHSLLATRIIARIRDVLHLEVPLRRFFAALDVARLAEVVEEIFVEKLEALPEEAVQRFV